MDPLDLVEQEGSPIGKCKLLWRRAWRRCVRNVHVDRQAHAAVRLADVEHALPDLSELEADFGGPASEVEADAARDPEGRGIAATGRAVRLDRRLVQRWRVRLGGVHTGPVVPL